VFDVHCVAPIGFTAPVTFTGDVDSVGWRKVYDSFLSLSQSLAKLDVDDAILDGEVICLDGNGASQFNHLISRKYEPVFYAFDLLWLDGKDLRKLPLTDRKERLEKLLKKSKCKEMLYAHHVLANGVALFEEICARDLEGIIAKRKRGIYKDDGKDWLKIKNPNYSRAEGRHDLLKHNR
jgi:bifunctional non-homologous end joining protein LigD